MPLRKYSATKATDATYSSDGFTTPRVGEGGGGEFVPPEFTAEATQVSHEDGADVVLTGTYPDLNLEFKIPEAEPPEFTATASSVSSTTPPDVDITGDYPNLNLAFKIPQGKDGVSPPPPTAITFTISGESGDHSAAYITGSYPNWHISLVLQRGEKGDRGDVGPQGPPGVCNCTCDCCNPDPPPCPPDGTVISAQINRSDIYYDAGCGPMTIGYDIVDLVADGNCGSREYQYQQWNTGFVGYCNGYNYYVDSQGNVTSEWADGGSNGGNPPTCPTGYHPDEFGNCVPDQPM